MAPITIRGVTVDPADINGKRLLADVQKCEYILIQIDKNKRKGNMPKVLQENQIDVKEIIDGITYLCRYQPRDFATINLDFILLVAPYHPIWKCGRYLDPLKEDNSTKHTLDIVLHPETNPSLEEAQAAVKALKGPQILSTSNNTIRIETEPRFIDEIAKIESVRSIEQLLMPQYCNNHVRDIIRINQISQQRSSTFGELDGTGEVVAIVDSGVDDSHHALNGRVIGKYPSEADTDRDINGHGTHIAGTIIANGRADETRETYGTQTTGFIAFQGMAPNASLVIEQFGMTGKETRTEYEDFFLRPHKAHGARISNNSWNVRMSNFVDPQIPYRDIDAYTVDRFAYDRPDLLIVFAAGNDGLRSCPAQIGGFAAAKNVITVGASMSDRPVTDEVDRGDERMLVYYPNGNRKDLTHEDDVAKFSSRGPTKEGRLKPDIVAPGVAILSTASKYVKGGDRGGTATRLQRSEDDNYDYATGTSTAAPVISGCAALLRQALSRPPHSYAAKDITSALLKALLINGAKLLPTGDNPEGPNNRQGYGRVDMEATMRPLRPPPAAPAVPHASFRKNYINPIPTSRPNVDLGPIKAPANTPGKRLDMKTTLVYIDYPGAHLQAELMLQVKARLINSKVEVEKNGFQSSWSNVQQVLMQDVKGGSDVTIEIVPFEFPRRLHWAVVWDFLETDRNGIASNDSDSAIAPISICGVTIDPASPDDSKLLSEIPQSEHILVQLHKGRHLYTRPLEENQIEVKELINDVTYMCYYPPRDFRAIKLDCVSSVVPYHPVWKIWDFYDHMMAKDPTQKAAFTVVIHEESVSSIPDVQAVILGLNGPEIMDVSGKWIDVKMELRLIYEIAKIESVLCIEMKLKPSIW